MLQGGAGSKALSLSYREATPEDGDEKDPLHPQDSLPAPQRQLSPGQGAGVSPALVWPHCLVHASLPVARWLDSGGKLLVGERRDVARELGGPLTEAFTGAVGSRPPGLSFQPWWLPSPGPVRPSLSSPSTALPPLPSRLPLPVQPMGVGVWLSPGKRIISSVMYIQTRALLLGRTRQGEGARAAGRRGFITRLLNLNLSPPGMGLL